MAGMLGFAIFIHLFILCPFKKFRGKSKVVAPMTWLNSYGINEKEDPQRLTIFAHVSRFQFHAGQL